jgi:ERCC4-related helicase
MLEEINRIRPFDGSHITLYPYGSRIYGTATEKSDYDFICVCGIKCAYEVKFSFGDVTYYTETEFINALEEHEISVLECAWIKPIIDELHMVIRPLIDKAKLRAAISAKASNSWVKCKKKLTVGSVEPKEDDREIGLKSLFHAFRILDFGYQIATQEKIVSYSSVNYIWDELKDFTGTWDQLNEKYKVQFNKAHSEFRKVAPKSKEDSLLETFKSNDSNRKTSTNSNNDV